MAYQETYHPVDANTPHVLPRVRRIGLRDLTDALAKGFDDFWAMPSHVVFLGLIYPVAGLIIARAALGYDMIPLLYPLATGFALIGPFAAIGLYELSRRRELGLETSWRHAFEVVHADSFRAILALGLLLLVIFAIWIAAANAIYIAHFGYAAPDSIAGFLSQVLTTDLGRSLILVGNVVGFVFALVCFSIAVVAFPLLIDRDISATAAAATSIEAVVKNPLAMAAWGLIVAALLLFGSLSLFVGLAVVVPVLGHATWHLYRKVVAPDLPQRSAAPPARPRGHRSAAEFPASLFTYTTRD